MPSPRDAPRIIFTCQRPGCGKISTEPARPCIGKNGKSIKTHAYMGTFAPREA